ncbi:hypothetical protein QL810_004563 [Escherichia coli]|nr:hypothetical protein [Escherichia coli]
MIPERRISAHLVPRPNGSAEGGAVQAWPERAQHAPALGTGGINWLVR